MCFEKKINADIIGSQSKQCSYVKIENIWVIFDLYQSFVNLSIYSYFLCLLLSDIIGSLKRLALIAET